MEKSPKARNEMDVPKKDEKKLTAKYLLEQVEKLTMENSAFDTKMVVLPADLVIELAYKIDEQQAEIEKLKCDTNKTSWKGKFLEAKKEIERLTEEKWNVQDDLDNYHILLREKEKQVDELLRDKGFLIAERTHIKEQATKDTAKEILYDIKYGFVFSYNAKNESYQDGYDQALEDYDNNLEKYFKERYGVEVE